MSVFIIGNDDFSSNVLVGTYEVNRHDEFKEIQDANGLYHRLLTRANGRITGTFDMRFLNPADYERFVASKAAHKTSGGYYPCTVAVNNELTNVSSNFYIDMSPVRNRNGSGRTVFDTFTVTIEER